MLNLLGSLQQIDEAILRSIAQYWGVNVNRLEVREIPRVLEAEMRNPDVASKVWDKLDDVQRGALQMLISSKNQLQASMFERMHGEIRRLGRGGIERENPINNPKSVAEGLFYRGLIFVGYANTLGGSREVVYIPPELIAALPTHKTTYDDLGDFVPETPNMPTRLNRDEIQLDAIETDYLENVITADTTIIDDMTTLLGYLQVHGGQIANRTLSPDDQQALSPHLLNADPQRLAFLLQIGIGGDLIDLQDGVAVPQRSYVKRWLEARRSEQLQILIDAWLNSAVYMELWHIEGLHPEPETWLYDAVSPRKLFLEFLRDFTPAGEWWSTDDFIMVVKEVEPDFQRPNGDYDNWYIRNDEGEYLKGFDSWDAVEGAVLEFYLSAPMVWLGVVDTAEDAARLNAYGRALVNGEKLPNPPHQDEPIHVTADGVIQVSRRASRMDRFQVMRFTTWVSRAGDGTPYTYKISMEGVRRGATQNINTSNIEVFLKRVMGVDSLPPTLAKQLETWGETARQTVSLEELLVLRTTSPETLDAIMEEPTLRRYCGARLGSMAVAVRREQWESLRDALEAQGIAVELFS